MKTLTIQLSDETADRLEDFAAQSQAENTIRAYAADLEGHCPGENPPARWHPSPYGRGPQVNY